MGWTLRSMFPRWDDQVIQDLTQEGMVSLLRAVRREPAENLPGLIRVVAHSTAMNALSAWYRERARSYSLEQFTIEPSAGPTGPRSGYQDPLVRLRWVVIALFRRHDSHCVEIAVDRFSRLDFQTIAVKLGISHDACRKQWSRCVQRLRALVKSSKQQIFDWIHEYE